MSKQLFPLAQAAFPFLFPRGRRLFRLFCIVLSLFAGSSAYWLQGRVVKVIDGDSLTVFDGFSGLRTVRLYGVDAPEMGQPFGVEAKQFAAGHLLLRTVSLHVLDIDRYQREVAVLVLPDGRLFNEELLKSGLGMLYPAYCKEAFCEDWARYEKQARLEKKGLWRQSRPQAPWKWRAGKRAR